MMYKEDWLMKQITNIVRAIARIVFQKDIITYEITNNETNTEADLLYKELIALLRELKINDAENLLFDCIKTTDLSYLKIAVDFYSSKSTPSKCNLH